MCKFLVASGVSTVRTVSTAVAKSDVFLPENILDRVSRRLEERNYLTHEFGDLCLILPTA